MPIAGDNAEDMDSIARFNVGLGFENGLLSVTGELVSTGTLGDVEDEDDRFSHFAAGSGSYSTASGVQPYVAFGMPLDEDLRDFIDFFAIVGVRYVFPGGPVD